MPLNDTEITELWRAFKKGDKVAFGQLASIFYKILYNYGTKLCQNTDLVEDCIQDLFLDIWKRREFLGETEYVKFYLLKSLRRKIYFEKTAYEKLVRPMGDFEEDINFMSEFSIETQLIEAETQELHLLKLKQVLSKLTKREREVIYLKFYQEMDYEQIANIMSINYQSARNLIHTAIKELKNVWFDEQFPKKNT